MADPRIGTLTVGGLDLARRRDFSALVTLEIAAERAVVTRALRLPQMPYREQLELIVAPILADLDALAYDAGGVGDAVGEGLPIDAIPIVIVAGDSAPVLREGRWRVGKVASDSECPRPGRARSLVGSSRQCPAQACCAKSSSNSWSPRPARAPDWRRRGRAHDDLVLALALAVLAARFRAEMGVKEGR